MCFAPHRGELFQHLNFQKWSGPGVFCAFWGRNVLRTTTACLFRHLNFQKWFGPGVFCTFWLRHVLRATTACTFSTSQLPKVVRSWCVLYILTSKCASRHNGVQFFISHLASWLRTRRFNRMFRDFPTFSRTCIFFLLTLYLLWSSLCCSSLLFFDSYHLCFSSVHTVGSLTSKLPSINMTSSLCNQVFLKIVQDRFETWFSMGKISFQSSMVQLSIPMPLMLLDIATYFDRW